MVVTGVARRAPRGNALTTCGVSALARVWSCSCIAAVEPIPSAGAPISRRDVARHCGQASSRGTSAIEYLALKSGHPPGQRN